MMLMCLFLSGIIYLQLNAGKNAIVDAGHFETSAREVRSLPSAIAYDPPEYALFRQANERPLFSPDRRPSAVPPSNVVTTAPTTPKLGFELVGVLISDKERLALIKQEGVAELRRIGMGLSLNGWQVEAIETDYVILRDGAEVRKVSLREDRPSLQNMRTDRRRDPDDDEIFEEEDDEDGVFLEPTSDRYDRLGYPRESDAVARAPRN